MGLNEIFLDDIPHIVPQTKTFEPRPKYRSLYDALYKEFKKIYKNNRAMYRRLNQNTERYAELRSIMHNGAMT
jgi:uncharacterized pyridoxamine 5'-phosphate oxidase family protein